MYIFKWKNAKPGGDNNILIYMNKKDGAFSNDLLFSKYGNAFGKKLVAIKVWAKMVFCDELPLSFYAMTCKWVELLHFFFSMPNLLVDLCTANHNHLCIPAASMETVMTGCCRDWWSKKKKKEIPSSNQNISFPMQVFLKNISTKQLITSQGVPI